MAWMRLTPWLVAALVTCAGCRRLNPAFGDAAGGTAGSEGVSTGAGTAAVTTAGSASATGTSTTGATTGATCGNGTIDPGEECDGDNLGGVTCVGQGFQGGMATCKDDCTLDLGKCVGSGCGDGVIDPEEECDATNLGGATCADVNMQSGMPICTLSCKLDYGACYTCGDGNIDGPEVCDGSNVDGTKCQDFALQGYHGPDPVGCAIDCLQFDLSECPLCGNDKKEDGEVCDGTDLDGKDCSNVGIYDAGQLACESDCTAFNISQCTLCGNDAIEGTEQCEPNVPLPETCISLGFDADTPGPDGGLACTGECTFDTSGCCNEVGSNCDKDDECCGSLFCYQGICAEPGCKYLDEPCNGNGECCSGQCNNVCE